MIKYGHDVANNASEVYYGYVLRLKLPQKDLLQADIKLVQERERQRRR